MPPKKIKLNTDPNQRSVALMFGKKSNELESESTEEAQESKQNALIDLLCVEHEIKQGSIEP